MSHVVRDKTKVLARTRRIRGQMEALEKALSGEPECVDVLTQLAAVRGAVHGLMMQVFDDHLREHMAAEPDAKKRDAEVTRVASIMKTYFK
jgi:DNA-binding FrmR family transcriptional regulator